MRRGRPARRIIVQVGALTVMMGLAACDVTSSSASVEPPPDTAAQPREPAPTSTPTIRIDRTPGSTTGRTATSTTIAPSTTVTPSTIAPSTVTPSTVAPSTIAPSTVTPSTITPSTVAPVRHLSMAFTGDTLTHSPLWRQATRNAAAAGDDGYDFDPMLAELTQLLGEVDLAVCHLETPIVPVGEELSTMPRYGVPPEVVGMLANAGFDRCSTASNHTIDRGFAGIVRTVDTLEAHGMGQAGMARTPDEIEPRVFDVGGVAVTHLSYTWSYNGLRLAEGDEWQSALIDPDRILADALVARSLGAEVVVVSLHWGAEGVHEPTRYQREIADRLTAPGVIDLIVGHHAHVLQPIEQVNGTWVLFGLGNILSNLPTSDRWPAASQDAAVVTVGFEVGGDGVAVGQPVVHPTWVDKDAGWIVRVVEAELARDDLNAGRRGRLEGSLARTESVLGDYLAPAATSAARAGGHNGS